MKRTCLCCEGKFEGDAWDMFCSVDCVDLACLMHDDFPWRDTK